MDHEALVRQFSQSVGVEKADSLVSDALDAVDVPEQETYSNDDVRDICESIQYQNDGYVSVIASEIRVRKEAETRFQALLENVPDPAVVVEFEDREPTIASVNDAFVETFGYDRDVAIGRNPLDFLVPPAVEEREHARKLWLTRSDESGQEVRRVTADGEIRTFLFRPVVVTRETGDVEGYGIYTDITDRKRQEQQLEHQNEQLEQFVSMVSHDLRNPLSVAEGYAELALETASDESVRDTLEEVVDAHQRMESLIEDLLSLARQGKVVGETEPVDLEACCRAAWRNVSTSEASLELDLDAVHVEADESRLRELLENCFRNSLEHAIDDANEDDLTVRVGVPTDGGSPGFFVEDDGRGIPESDRERIFEQGYTTNEDGTGFGLSIVESIAEAHGWRIRATESDGGGARFEITDVSFHLNPE
jgi:PAS domain S-box-containing protein